MAIAATYSSASERKVIEGRARRHTATRYPGSGFNVGETLLYRAPDQSWDTPVQFRAIDGNDALVIFPARSHSTIVPISWLRRGQLARP
jgi:hypothetical protein